MEVGNTLAFYNTATITAVKCFIVQAPSVNLITFFFFYTSNEICISCVGISSLEHYLRVNLVVSLPIVWGTVLHSTWVSFRQKDRKYLAGKKH